MRASSTLFGWKTKFQEKWIKVELLQSLQQTALITLIPKHNEHKLDLRHLRRLGLWTNLISSLNTHWIAQENSQEAHFCGPKDHFLNPSQLQLPLQGKLCRVPIRHPIGRKKIDPFPGFFRSQLEPAPKNSQELCPPHTISWRSLGHRYHLCSPSEDSILLSPDWCPPNLQQPWQHPGPNSTQAVLCPQNVAVFVERTFKEESVVKWGHSDGP